MSYERLFGDVRASIEHMSPEEIRAYREELKNVVNDCSARLAAHGVFRCKECGSYHKDGAPHIPFPDFNK